jgi:hypothetical protein
LSQKPERQKRAFKRAVAAAAVDLFTRKQHGHMGDIAYYNGGGKLFEDFVKANDNYALYNGEIRNISIHKKAIATDVAGTERAIIVGPGPASSFRMKEMQILKLLPDLKEIHLIDVNHEFNRQARKAIEDFSQSSGRKITVKTYQMDFRMASAAIPPAANTTVFSTGSLVSNVPNAPLSGFPDYDIGIFMEGFARLAGVGGKVVLGYDANETGEEQVDHYNDDLAPFIKNIMKVVADHASGIKGFNPAADHFRYEAEWVKKAGQVAHKLVVVKPQHFEINMDDRIYQFALYENDEFIVMSSLKPSVTRLSKVADRHGMATDNTYSDGDNIIEQVFTVKSLPQADRPPLGLPDNTRSPS